jgi:TPR repeat protein
MKHMLIKLFSILFLIAIFTESYAKNNEVSTDSILTAAMGGEGIQQYNTGYNYLTGTGDVQQSDKKAKYWFDLAAQSNIAGVRYKIGRLFETGTLYKQSYTKAVMHYNYAAGRGDVYAINNLAILYLNGTGVTQDINKGIGLLTQAAEKANVEAQVNLGLYYLSTKSDEDSLKNALQWFTEAAKANNPEALFYLAEHAFAEQDYVKAYDYYLHSAQQSNSNAQLKLAMLYGKGLGIDKDHEQSVKWLKESAKLGNQQAIAILNRLKQK